MRTAKQLAQDPAMMQDISRFDTMHLDWSATLRMICLTWAWKMRLRRVKLSIQNFAAGPDFCLSIP